MVKPLTVTQLDADVEELTAKVNKVDPLVKVIDEGVHDLPALLSSAAGSKKCMENLSNTLASNTKTLESINTEF